jgi:hypothetical protein
MDLKNLLSKYRISWRDRGPNCSRNNVNVSCPFCGSADHSFHMAISLNATEYYCFRNPRHAGTNLAYLFKALGIPASEYAHLKFDEVPRTWKADDRNYSAWQHFTPAEENQEVLNYLKLRLFNNPVDVCRQFVLKCTNEGEWAGRLLIPLNIGWTGRSMRPHITLRYKAFTSQDGFFLHRQGSTSIIVTEGALDAMRIASVSTSFDVIAKCRMALSPAILNYLRESNYLSIWNSPDGTVPYSQHRLETSTLKSYCTKADVNWLKLSEGTKDFGELEETKARKLLSTVGGM